MKITSLEDLLVDELKDLYSAETQLIKTLPKLAQAAESEELRTAFEEHLEKTRGHAQRIEQISQDLSIKPQGKTCLGMEGLLKEGQELLDSEQVPQAAVDAGLIGAAQRVEHYEIAAYGTAAAHAQQLGFQKVVDLLNQTLAEEKEADQRLSNLAHNRVNVQAASDNGPTTTTTINKVNPKDSTGVPKEDLDRWKSEGGAQ
jgi:ferritin-like metal-binding protein YciE